MESHLEQLSRAERMLAAVATAEEAATVVDYAAAARDLAKRAKLGADAVNHATVIRVRAERRMAELVDEGQARGEIETTGGRRGNQYAGGIVRTEDNATLPQRLKEDLGIDRRRLMEARKLTKVPEQRIIEAANEASSRGREVSRKSLIRLADTEAAPAPAAPLPDIVTGSHRVIVADPPWRYDNSATRGDAQGHYQGTLSVPELTGEEPMPSGDNLADLVKSWCADDAHLYLWTTAGFLREAFDVMDAWGFTYKTFLAWVKPQMGMGNYFRVSSELVLFGVRGKLAIEDRSIMNWFEAKRGRHSAKPQRFYDLVAKASPGPYLEMFARCDAGASLPGMCSCAKCLRGWTTWGNEA